MCVINSWKLLRYNGYKSSLLNHTRKIVAKLISPQVKKTKEHDSKIAKLIKSKQCPHSQLTRDLTRKRLQCAVFHNSTVYFCHGCNTRLHIDCFNVFHE